MSSRATSYVTGAAIEGESIQGDGAELYLSDEEVDELISDAASFICVLDDLRPLDPSTYNPFYEVWTRIARIPPEERYRLLDELDPGCLRSLWRASMARYVLDEARSLELFAEASVWDDFPSRPGQVFGYEGRCESYRLGGSAAVRLERLSGSGRGPGPSPGLLSPSFGGDAASAPTTPLLRPAVGAPELRADRFKQLFFVPPEGCGESAAGSAAAGGSGGGGAAGGWGSELQQQLEPAPPRIYSRVMLPLAGPLDRWWDPLYCRLRVQLTLTPLSRDAGADLQLLYPQDPAVAAPDDGTEPEPTSASAGGGGGIWALLGPECLPPASGLLALPWPDPDPLSCGVSPFSGGPRDFMRAAGPGVYVGCAYVQGPGPGEYREENFVYFVIARRY